MISSSSNPCSSDSRFPSDPLYSQHEAAALILYHTAALAASLWLGVSSTSFKTHVKLGLLLNAFADQPSTKRSSLNPIVNTVGKPQLFDTLLIIMLK